MHTQNMHPGDNDLTTDAERLAVRTAMVDGLQVEGMYQRSLDAILADTGVIAVGITTQKRVEMALAADAAFYVHPVRKQGMKGDAQGDGVSDHPRIRYTGTPV